MNNSYDEETGKLAAHVHALGMVAGLLLAVAPNKRRLLLLWDQTLAERISAWMDDPAYQHPVLRDELHKQLAMIRETLAEGAQSEGGD